MATLLAIMIATSGGLSFFTTNNANATMNGNMMRPGGTMGPGMMGMGPGMMGMGPGMMGMGPGMMGMGPGMMGMGPGMMGMGPGMMGMGPGMMGMGPGMLGMGPGMMIGNQNQSNMMMQMVGAGQNVTGSINLFSTVSNAIETQVKVSLSDAASAAEGAVDNSSHAVAAHIGEANGYLIYCVWVLGPGMNMNMVIVDPGNGQVLSNTQISLQHLMMMGMGPGMMGMGPGMMGMGPGMMGMGPGMMGHGSWNDGYGSWNDGYGSWNDGYGSWNDGYGSWNDGYGSWNDGYGSWNDGYGSWNDGLWNDAVNVCIIVRGKNLHFLYCSFRMSFLSIRSEITLTDRQR